jgi:hypothetical protein
MEISDSAIITCSDQYIHLLIHTPSIVTHIKRDNIYSECSIQFERGCRMPTDGKNSKSDLTHEIKSKVFVLN